jgi:hypothetical protein
MGRMCVMAVLTAARIPGTEAFDRQQVGSEPAVQFHQPTSEGGQAPCRGQVPELAPARCTYHTPSW